MRRALAARIPRNNTYVLCDEGGQEVVWAESVAARVGTLAASRKSDPVKQPGGGAAAGNRHDGVY